MMVREPPPLRIRPRLEVGDRAIQQPVVVVVGLVQRDEVFDGVDEIAEQRELLRRRRATVGTRPRMPEKLSIDSRRQMRCSTGTLIRAGLRSTV